MAEEDTYVIDERGRSIVLAAIDLLWKVVRSPFVTSHTVEATAKVIQVLEAIPREIDEIEATVQLGGPQRRYEDHEISHWWEVQVEEQSIKISSGGYFYRPSTGGDSFTSMQWTASPDYETELDDFSGNLGLVDDAMPFELEVAKIDLNEPGYSLTVLLDGEVLFEDDDDEEDDEESDLQ